MPWPAADWMTRSPPIREVNGGSVFSYERLVRVDSDGSCEPEWYSHDAAGSSHPPLPSGAHRIVGRLSRRAFELARLRNWPKAEAEVDALVRYSNGAPLALSLAERCQLFFIR